MKITKLTIKNLYGIKECELDGRSVEVTGTNGVGKSSIIDSIRYSLENKSNRDIILRKGATEGEVLLETNSGLRICRKVREGKADYKDIKQDNRPIMKPEAYLNSIFSPLQLDPVEFTRMSRQDQNRVILNLIEFEWDLSYIKEKFGEIPAGVDYDQHILKVLEDIQSEKGVYYQTRQEINRQIRHDEEFCAQIAKSLPEGYNAKKWREYDFNGRYSELSRKKETNDRIARAKVFYEGYAAKLKALEMTRDTDIHTEEQFSEDEKVAIQKRIARYEHEIEMEKQRLSTIDDALASKISVIKSNFEASKAKLDKDNAIAAQWAGKEPEDVSELESEVKIATEMISYLKESDRLEEMKGRIGAKREQSEELTRKIELARELPAEILKEARIPVEGLTVVDGEPMIDRGNGPLPINSLSEGEQLDLCVDVALSKPNNLEIILIDGIERLSEANRQRIYAKCKEKGLQFIATRTTDSEELEVVYL